MSANHGLEPVGSADHVQGSSTANVTLVEYGDYQCSFCGEAYQIIKRIQNRLGTPLRFVFRNFPMAEAHPFATAAAEMAEAAALQDKFWQTHDMLYEHQDALEPDNLFEYARHLHLDMTKLKAALTSSTVIERVSGDFIGGTKRGERYAVFFHQRRTFRRRLDS